MSKEIKEIQDNDEDSKVQLESLSNEELLAEATAEDSEAVQDEVQEDIVQEVEEKQELSPEIQKAKKNGHLSQEEYQKKYGTLDGYKSPEEFNRFGDIYPEIKDSLKGISKKLEQRDRELESLSKYIMNVREREQRAARQELAQALKHAQEMCDVEAVRHLTREEAKLDYKEAQEAALRMQEQENLVRRSFEERNPWYNRDPEMTARAIQIDQEIREGRHSHLMPMPQTPEQLGRQIEVLMNQEFGDRARVGSFNQRSAPVINNTRSAINKTTAEHSIPAFRNLSSDHKNVYMATKNMLEKQGIKYTEQEFIKKLQKDGEI